MDFLNVEQIFIEYLWNNFIWDLLYLLYLLNGSSFQTQNILGKYQFNILKL